VAITVSVIPTATNQVVATIDVGGSAGDLAFSADGTTAYATIPSRNFVKTISTAIKSVRVFSSQPDHLRE
jgi:DNA-binding beta-propeller fold protein YncE